MPSEPSSSPTGKGGTWIGIGGKRPNWFKDALAAGRKPEDLLAKPDA